MHGRSKGLEPVRRGRVGNLRWYLRTTGWIRTSNFVPINMLLCMYAFLLDSVLLVYADIRGLGFGFGLIWVSIGGFMIESIAEEWEGRLEGVLHPL